MPFNLLSNLRCVLRYDALVTPYVDGELDDATAQQVRAHLTTCERCRRAVDEHRFAARLVATIAPPAEFTALPPFIDAEIAARSTSRSSRGRRLMPAVAVSIIVLAVAAFWVYNRLQSSTWEVISLAGSPTVNTASIQQTGRLAEGGLLETDQASRARVQVGKIGYVDVEANSRLRLTSTKMTEQRVTLERGKLRATISAPPRIFFVDTPSAEAVDLGCAYTLEADESGKGLLQVTAGWVAFVLSGFELKVPAGAACQTRPEVGPGTPFFVDTSAEFQNDLQKIDFDKSVGETRLEALDRLLSEARPRDTLTLFYLLYRLGDDDRPKVYDKLESYVAPPDGVTKEGVLQLNKKMLDEYRELLEPTWLQETAPGLRKIWRWVWS